MDDIPKNSNTKAPSFQFYPKDWLNDEGLELCSWATRGVWIHLICKMHSSNSYGTLCVNGHNLTVSEIKGLLVISTKVFNKCWGELIKRGVIRQDENGMFYNKRLVGDHELRVKRSKAGKMGGNPKLMSGLNKQEDKQLVKQGVKQDVDIVDKEVDNSKPTLDSKKIPPPSSSSSSSTSSTHIKEVEKEEQNNNGLYPNESFRASDDNKINEAAEIVCSLYFITEIQNFQSYAKVYSSLEIINTEYGMDPFIKQVEAYREYKMLSGQEKHRFQKFLGDPHNSCSDGAWCSENWIKVLEEYKVKKGISDEKENQPTMKEMKKANNE